MRVFLLRMKKNDNNTKKKPAVGQEFVHCKLSLKPVFVNLQFWGNCVNSILGKKEKNQLKICFCLFVCLGFWIRVRTLQVPPNSENE